MTFSTAVKEHKNCILLRISKQLLLTTIAIFLMVNTLVSQQTTGWTSVSPTVWETVSDDGLVRVEARVSAGVSILGNETMGCTSDATYGDPTPDVFGSQSLEISASPLFSGTLEFFFLTQ